MNIRKIQRQKTQLVINLPKQVCRDFGWKEGDYLRIRILARGVLEITKVEPPKNG